MSTARAATLALLSGLCGLGSEVILFKLLDETVGSAPIVAYLVVALSIIGMGLGALWSRRVRRPARVETLLAAYHFAWLVCFTQIFACNAWLLGLLAPHLGADATAALLGALYILPPALLLGISLPVVIELHANAGRAYALNAVGAFVAAVLVEVLLYPRLGARITFALLGVAHLVMALLLWRVTNAPQTLGRTRLPAVLILTGIATGALQGLWLHVGGLVFRPFYFIAPLVVTTMLLGLSIGSALWLQRRVAFARVVQLVLCGLVLCGVATVCVVHARAATSLWPILVELPLLLLPAAIPIGALLPAFLRERPATRSEAGAALLALSLGNALGVLAAACLLVRFLPPMWCFVAVALWLAAVELRAALIAALLLASLSPFANELAFMRRAGDFGRVDKIEWLQRGIGEVSAIYDVMHNGKHARRIYQNGFSPIELGRGGESAITIVGAAYAPQLTRALVIGAGSGRSAGTAAEIFAHVDVVDLGDTVPALVRALPEENFSLLTLRNVTYHAIDGIVAPLLLAPGYDLIVVTIDPGHLAKAHKIYSVESLRRLRALLRPGGVLIAWSDLGLGAESNQVLINDGLATFAHQKLFSVRPSANRLDYYFLVDSDEPLFFHTDRIEPWRALLPNVVAAEHWVPHDESDHLLVGRAHPTHALHSLDHPAPSLLFGVEHGELIPLTPQ